MKLKTIYVAMAIVIAVFIKACFLPGWPALFEFISASTLLGFVIWFNPEERKIRDDLVRKVEQQNESIQVLRQEIGIVKARIGFRG